MAQRNTPQLSPVSLMWFVRFVFFVPSRSDTTLYVYLPHACAVEDAAPMDSLQTRKYLGDTQTQPAPERQRPFVRHKALVQGGKGISLLSTRLCLCVCAPLC